MLMIRLQRVGRKHDPSFRVVLTDKRNGPQSGKFLEVLGSYNARFGTPSLKGDRIKYWVGKGAKLSDTLHNLLVSEKVIEGKKINVLPKKSPIPTDEVVGTPTESVGVVKEVSEEEKKEEKAETSTDTEAVTDMPAETPAVESPSEPAEKKTVEAEEAPAVEEKKEETPVEEEAKEETKEETPATEEEVKA